MLEGFDNAVITDIRLAMYVDPGIGVNYHNNRTSHGLVINDTGNNKDYIFSDCTTIKTKAFSVFYLPKGSTYRINDYNKTTGCWAINFDLRDEISEKPFVVQFKSSDSILDNFKECVNAFKKSLDNRDLIIRKNLYEIILKIKKECAKNYTPGKKAILIKPALDYINQNFNDNDLSVKELARICGISENYLRRIFQEKVNQSPKEYIIKCRIDYAKKLLLSGQFSVSEIAEMCGYTEPCHFSREFSKRAGVVPNKYKTALYNNMQNNSADIFPDS